MKIIKKTLSVILAMAMALLTFCPISVFAISEHNLQLNVLAVNSYGGELRAGSVLTVQYADATLGNNDSIKLYAQVKQLSTGVQSEKIEVCSLNYSTVQRNAYDPATQITAQNKMGAVDFTFPASLSVTDSGDYVVFIWSEDSFGHKSSVSENTINDNFEGLSSDWSEVSGSDWMKYIDSSQMISQINLPATHDSGSVKFNLLVQTFSKTQDVYIDTQLTYGVRFLDIRVNTNACTLSDPSLSIGTTDYRICHGSTNAQKADGSDYTMSEVIKQCYDFLDAHPTEFIYFNVQQDNNRNDEDFQRTIHEYIAKNPDKWFVKGFNPTLGEVRGKLVYARRFESAGYGDYANGVRFYADAMEDSSPSNTYVTGTAKMENASLNNAPHEIVYHMQDFYKTSAADKWEIVKRQLDSNCYSKPRNEYFYSGLNAAGKIAVAPSTIAKTVNSKFTDYTLDTGKQWGWISFDFVTEALAKKVYSTNIKAKTASDDPSFKKVVLHYDFTSIGDDHVVQDLTGNGFDGIITNPSLITKNNGDITLNNSGKRRLDGAGIDIPSYAFRGTGSEVTISAFIKPTEGGNKTWFSAGDPEYDTANDLGTLNNWVALITGWNGSGPRWATRSKGLDETNYNSSGALEQNKWQLLTYVMDGSSVKIYIDGELSGAYTGINASFDDVGSTVAMSIGRATYWNDEDFVGSIGDFKVFNYALNANEITDEYNSLMQP